MKEQDKDALTKVAEKMAQLIEKGREMALKEEYFRNALGTRLKTRPKSK